ncbi:MAG: ATP-binding response regulator [Gammaproteobacteria bacterium]
MNAANPAPAPLDRSLNSSALLLSLATLLLGLVVVFGWHTGNRTLVQILPQFVPMQYNTALGFIFSGLALLGLGRRIQWLALTAGGIATLIGVLTLFEYIAQFDLGIDELFMDHEVTVKTSHPGRMAPNTAACFTLMGLAIAWSPAGWTNRARSLLRISLASFAFGLSTVALAGYLTGLETAYGWGNLTRMALHTSVGFIVVSLGTLCLMWSRDTREHTRLPPWLPVPIAIGVLTATLCFWQALSAENARIQAQYAELNSLATLADVMLIVGTLLAAALALAANLAQTANRRAREADRANKLLEAHRANLEVLVTERTRELEKAMAEAESANRAKSTFLANMSHELRTPLNAVIGYSEMVAEDLESEGQGEHVPDLKRIHSSGKHLLSLINDILDLSKVEAGRMDLYLERFDLQEMVDDVVATIEPLAAQNNNEFAVKTGENLGTVRADLTKVRQSLFNLLSNAAKFTKDGRITLSVARGEDEGRDMVLMSVTDTGIGIPEDKREKIFEEFSQADQSTSRDFGGTGLGLAITRRFCEMMGGSVEVQSELGKGSTFFIRLPAKVDPLEAARAALDEPVDQSPGQAPTKAAVLVIDDDEDARSLLRRTLEADGYEVLLADSAEKGLAVARAEAPAVITLDVSMPGTDGWAALRELKADEELREIPVVMVSIMHDKGLGFALGAAEYLTKPVDRDKLLNTVQHLVESGVDSHVLVVDDQESDRELVVRALEQAGQDVVEADNGRHALERVTARTPSLIILDLMMPVMDGFEFLRELRRLEYGQNIPVLVLTAKELSPPERDLLEKQAQSVLHKGESSLAGALSDLRTAVAAHLEPQ